MVQGIVVHVVYTISMSDKNKTVGIAELTRETAARLGISNRKAKQVVREFCRVLGDNIAARGRVRIWKLGVFERRKCKGKTVTDPQGRGVKHFVPDYQKVGFTSANALKEKINA